MEIQCIQYQNVERRWFKIDLIVWKYEKFNQNEMYNDGLK